MVVLIKAKANKGCWTRGKIGWPTEYGEQRYGRFFFGDVMNDNGVYQVRRKVGYRIQVRMKYSEPIDQTQPRKVARQIVFRNAMTAWHALTVEQQAKYNGRVRGRHMWPHNLYLKEYLKSH